MLTEIVNRVLAGHKERRLIIRKWLLSLRCDRITMVQPAESRQGLNLALTRREDFRRPTCWRVLRESKMSPVMPPPTFFADLMPVLRSASQVPVHRAAVRPSQDRWAISSLGMLPRSEKAGTGFTPPGHQQAAAETPNGKSGKILEFRKVG